MLTVDVTQQLGNFTLEVKAILPGRGITVIFGLSGAGKTSLLNIISGLICPQWGRVINNRRVLVDTEQGIWLPVEKRGIGYLFQDPRLFPHYRVRGNLEYGIADSMRSQFDDIVALLSIEGLLNRFPHNLSGGEKQRVAIGRTLLSAPELLLMDEPLASLDLPRKRELLPYLELLAQQVDIPILYVTHSVDEVLRLAENILLLEHGKVQAFGILETIWGTEVLRPWLKTQGGSVSVLKATLLKHHPNYQMSALSLGKQQLWVARVVKNPGEKLRILVYAKDVSLSLKNEQTSSISSVLRVDVISMQEIGGYVEVKLKVDEWILWAQISPFSRDKLQISPGMSLYAQVNHVVLIDYFF